MSFIDEGSSCFILNVMESYTKEIVPKIYTNEPLVLGIVDAPKSSNLEVLK